SLHAAICARASLTEGYGSRSSGGSFIARMTKTSIGTSAGRPAARIRAASPIRRKISIVRALQRSILGRNSGAALCSTRVQRTPRSPRSTASVSPTGPAPTTRTSVWSAPRSGMCGEEPIKAGREGETGRSDHCYGKWLTLAPPADIVPVAATSARPMRTLLACALLALVPLTSVRMVCFDAHATATTAADASDEAIRQAERECERVCKRHAAPQASAPVSCVLIPDPSCTFLAAGAVAVVPREVPSPAPAAGVLRWWGRPPAPAGGRRLEGAPQPDSRARTLPAHAPPPRGSPA